jgi:putative phosphoesterase
MHRVGLLHRVGRLDAARCEIVAQRRDWRAGGLRLAQASGHAHDQVVVDGHGNRKLEYRELGPHGELAIRIGIISDTHGLLRPAALDALRGSDRVVHAGDICDPAILHELARIAPLTAVRGNNDFGDWADALREVETVDAEGLRIGIIHDAKALGEAARTGGWRAIVAGHSHRPLCEMRGGVLHFNPGSAGPRRFSLPITVGEIVAERGTLTGRIIALSV